MSNRSSTRAHRFSCSRTLRRVLSDDTIPHPFVPPLPTVRQGPPAAADLRRAAPGTRGNPLIYAHAAPAPMVQHPTTQQSQYEVQPPCQRRQLHRHPALQPQRPQRHLQPQPRQQPQHTQQQPLVPMPNQRQQISAAAAVSVPVAAALGHQQHSDHVQHHQHRNKPAQPR